MDSLETLTEIFDEEGGGNKINIEVLDQKNEFTNHNIKSCVFLNKDKLCNITKK